MIYVNSIMIALRNALANDPVLTSSGYPIEVGVPTARFGNMARAITIMPGGMNIDPMTIGVPGTGRFLAAPCLVDIYHWAYTTETSGACLLELMTAQARIFMAVNSDPKLGGAVERTAGMVSELVQFDETLNENGQWNRVRCSFNVRGG